MQSNDICNHKTNFKAHRIFPDFAGWWPKKASVDRAAHILHKPSDNKLRRNDFSGRFVVCGRRAEKKASMASHFIIESLCRLVGHLFPHGTKYAYPHFAVAAAALQLFVRAFLIPQ